MLWRYWKILAIIYLGILFRALIVRSLYPIPLEKEFVNLNWLVTIPIGIGNAILVWLVGKKFFGERVAIFSVILYEISPWFAYLEAAGSIYIFLLFGLLLSFYGIFQVQKSPKFLTFLVTLVLATLLYGDFQRQSTIFSEVGLINAVNQFQGETKETDLIWVGRYIENRYIYFTEILLFNFLKHLTPLIYFTPEVKLLNFSFSPPILLGFLIPLIVGITAWFKLWKRYNLVTLAPLLLLILSVFSKQSPSLSKLVIFAPVIIFTISYGFIGLHRILKVTTILLVIIQIILVIFDIILREPIRFHG